MIRSQKGISVIEVLGGLAIICMVSLASAAISMQVLKTSKKSKNIALAIALEGAFLEALENPEQPGYRTVGDRLRAGTPPSEIELWSNFTTPETTTMSDRRLLYRLRLEPATPENLYINGQGQIVTEADVWVLQLRATYKQMPDAGDIPQYAVAYSISGNSVDASFKSFGVVRPGAFEAADFFYPLSQQVYFGNQASYTATPGTCQVDDARQVVSLYSIDLRSGVTRCVIKGNQCQQWEISTGVDMAVPNSGNISLDLTCKPINKCGCKHIAARNWVVTSFNPSQLVGDVGQRCGKCEFAFKPQVPAEGVPSAQATGSVDNYGICPAENYDVSSVTCEGEVVNVERLPSAPPVVGGVDPCQGEMPFGTETYSGTAGSAGKASCGSPSTTSNACYSWSYNVRIMSGQCRLRPPLDQVRDALTTARETTP